MASPFDSPLLLASAEPEFVPQYSKLFGRGTPTTSGQASWISNTVNLPQTQIINSVSVFHTFTFSCWIKRSLLNPNAGVTIPEVLFSINEGSNGTGVFVDTVNSVVRNKFTIGFQKNAENTWFRATHYGFNSATNLTKESVIYETALSPNFLSLLDNSSWFHIVYNFTPTGAADSNRLYINGLLWPSAKSVDYLAYYVPAGPATLVYGAGRMNNAAATPVRTNSPFHGYISEAYFIANQILGPEYFGQLDTKRGAPRWIPKRFTGTYNSVSTNIVPNAVAGTADHYLQFDNVEGSTAWKDSGPNNNTFGQDYIATTAWTVIESARTWYKIAVSSDGRYQTAVVENGQIYVNSNFGQGTWTAVESSRDWRDIAMSSDGRYQTAVANGQIYINNNFGLGVWTAVESARNWNSVAMSSDGMYQTAVVLTGQIYVNSNFGQGTWTAVESNRNWRGIAMSSDGKYQTAVESVAGVGRIYINSNFGLGVWTAVESNRDWYGIAVSSDGKYQTAIVLNGQIYINSDYGQGTWTAVESNRQWSDVSMSSDGKYQIATVFGGQIYVNNDYGLVAWTAVESNRNWRGIAISSDGRYLTAVGFNIQIYRLANVVNNLPSDQTVDVPYTIVSNVIDTGLGKTVRGNYCTLQGSAQSYQGTLLQPWFDQGNLQVSPVAAAGIGYQGGTSYLTSPGTIPITSGKWYFEATVKGITPIVATNVDRFRLGILSSKSSDSQSIFENTTTASAVGNSATSYAIRGNSASGTTLLQKITNSVATTFTWPSKTALAANDVLMCAVDMDSKQVWFGVNGFWCSDTVFNSTNISWDFLGWSNGFPGGDNWVNVSLSKTGKYIIAARNDTVTPLIVSSNYGLSFSAKTTGTFMKSAAVSDNGQYMLACNNGNLWLSTNYGETFNIVTAVGTGNFSSVALSEDGRYQTVVVDGGRIWRSETWGQTWTQVGDASNRAYKAVAMSANGTFQLAAVAPGQLWRSTNSGSTWTAVSITSWNAALWTDVAVSSDGLYQAAVASSSGAAANTGRIFRSVNSGSTWAATGDATGRPYSGIAMDATGRYVLVSVLATGPGFDQGSNVRFSTDFGVTFNAINITISWYSAAMSSTGNIIVVTGQQGIQANRLGMEAQQIQETGYTFQNNYRTPAAFSIANLTEALPAVSFYRGSETTITNLLEVNFGQRPYTYQAPSGYKSLCTSNLPEPLYPLASNFFDGRARTGTMSPDTVELSALAGGALVAVDLGPKDIAVTSDDRYVLVPQLTGINYTNTLNVIDRTTKTISSLRVPPTIQSTVNGIVISPDNQNAYITDTTANRIIKYTINGNWTAVESNRTWFDVAMSSDGKYQTAVTYGGQIYINDNYGQGTWTAVESNRTWFEVAMSSDGKYQTAVTYSNDQIYINDNYGQGTWTAVESGRVWTGIAMSSDGKYQTAVAEVGQIYINDNYGQGTWTAVESNRTWYGIAMSSDGKYQTAVAYSNNQIYINSNYGQGTWTAVESGRAWTGIAMSSDGKYQTAVVQGGQIYINDNYGQGTWTAVESNRIWSSIAMSSNGKYQTAVAQGGQIYINDNYGQGTWTAVESGRVWTGIAMSSDGKYQTAVTDSGRIYINSIYGAPPFTILTSSRFNQPNYLDISPDGNYLYISNIGNSTLVRTELSAAIPQISTRVASTTAYSTGSLPRRVKVSPNGVFVAVTNGGNASVTVLDTQTGNTRTISTDESTIGQNLFGVTISNDSKNIYVVGQASSIGDNTLGFIKIKVPDPFDINGSWITSNNTFMGVGTNPPPGLRDLTISSDNTTLYINTVNAGTGFYRYDLTTTTVTYISSARTNNPGIKLLSDDSQLLMCTIGGLDANYVYSLETRPVNSVQSLNFTPQLVWTKQNSGSVLADHHFAYSQPELTSPTNSRVTVAATNTVAVSSNANNGAIFNYYKKYSINDWYATETSRNWYDIAISSDGKYQTAVGFNTQIYVNSNYGLGTWTPVESVRAWFGIAMSSDGRYQTAVENGGQIYYNSNYGLGTWTGTQGPGGWREVAMSSDGRYQTVVATGGQIYVNSNYGQVAWSSLEFNRQWWDVAMSSDGRYQTAVVASAGQIYVNSTYGLGFWDPVESNRNWYGIAMSSDGRYQTAVASAGQIYVNSNYGLGTWTAVESSRSWNSISMSSDGRYQTAVENNGRIYVNSNYGLGTWTPVESSRGWNGIAMSSDGRYQTAVAFGGQIYVNGPYFENNRNNKYSLRYSPTTDGGRTNIITRNYNDYVWGSDPNILSITEYTGDGGANRTIPHTLGNIPDWVLIKRKTSASGWVQFVKTMAANSYFTWSNAAAVVNSAVFTTGSWSGSNVIVGTDVQVNASGVPYVMFAFKEIPGISSIGSYVTRYSTTWGTLVNTGFAPELILIKAAAAGNDWILFDNFSISSVNTVTNFLLPNSNVNSATAAGTQIDILSNGFKVRGTNARISSTTNTTFYYIAFAKSPFKYANGGKPFSSIL